MHQVRRRAVPLQPMNMNFMQQLPLARPDTGTSNALLIGSCKFPCNYNFFAFFLVAAEREASAFCSRRRGVRGLENAFLSFNEPTRVQLIQFERFFLSIGRSVFLLQARKCHCKSLIATTVSHRVVVSSFETKLQFRIKRDEVD